MRANARLVLPFLTHVAVATTLAHAAPPTEAAQPLDLVPAETILCWFGQPFPDTRPAGEGPSALATVVDLGTRLAGQEIDRGGQLLVRLMEGLGLVVRCPYALALVDARARPIESDPTARQVDRLRLALIVQTEGRAEPLLRVIQKIVNEQTVAGQTTLEQLSAEHWTYQRLTDARLPAWSTIAWGQVGRFFVVTLGEDQWPQVARIAAGKDPSLAAESWVRDVRSSRGPALIEIAVRTAAMRERLDPFTLGRATDFFDAWQAGNLDRALWRLGFEGRAMFCEAHLFENGVARRRLYADAAIRDPALLKLMPGDARYAIYRLPLRQLIPRVAVSLTATRGPEFSAAARRAWQRVEEQHGFDVESDLLAHLGDTLVLHNDPPHPLRLPLMFTALAEIRGDARRVRDTLDKVCAAWQEWLARSTEHETGPNPAAVQRDADGVWYLRFGPIATFAWTVTERYVVLSWSPTALRQYLARLPGPRP
jgi:hypothetical protein